VKFEASLQRQDELHAKYDLNLTSDNLKVAALQAEEEAETVAEQFLAGILDLTYWVLQRVAKLALQALYMLQAAYRLSVCPTSVPLSVCLSHSGIVSKRGNAEGCSFHHRVAQCP